MNNLETLQAQRTKLQADKAAIERQIQDVELEIEKIRLAAYPHKVGDVIEGRSGRPVKIKRIVAGVDDIFPVVVEKLPSGGWSKRERFMINWDRALASDKDEKATTTPADVVIEPKTGFEPDLSEAYPGQRAWKNAPIGSIEDDAFGDSAFGWRARKETK